MKATPDKGLKPLEATLEDLKIHWARPGISDSTPRGIPLAKLQVCPKAFQMRHVSPKTRTGVSDPTHVTKLAERLDREGTLDPILVLPISYKRYVIIDGFHRAAAYKRRRRESIPAVIFTGTPSEAKLLAIRENAKTKLELTSQEKSDYLLSLIVQRPLDDNGKPWTLQVCAQAADRSPRLAETISAYVSKCRERGQDVPDRWQGGNWDKGDQDDETVSRRVREKAEQLRAAIGDMKTPGAIRLVAQALQHAYERAGDLAGALLQESGDFEALVPDWEERLAEACEEAVSEAREDWQREQAGGVDAVREQVATVTRQMDDLRLHGSITNLIFGAAKGAGSLREYREALSGA